MVPEKVVSKPLLSGPPETGTTPAYFSKTTFNSQLLSQLLSSPDVAHGIISTLKQDEAVVLPGDFTTIQL